MLGLVCRGCAGWPHSFFLRLSLGLSVCLLYVYHFHRATSPLPVSLFHSDPVPHSHPRPPCGATVLGARTPWDARALVNSTHALRPNRVTAVSYCRAPNGFALLLHPLLSRVKHCPSAEHHSALHQVVGIEAASKRTKTIITTFTISRPSTSINSILIFIF